MARPQSGLSHYGRARYEGTDSTIAKALAGNETLMIDITIHRSIVRQVFTLTRSFDMPEALSRDPSVEKVP